MDNPHYLSPMLDCISVENMRRSDALTIERYVPSLELMGRAARGVYLACRWKGPVAIVAGSGNNGGDGFALACILQENDIDCTVFTLSHRLSADSAFYAQKARDMGVKIIPFTAHCLQDFSTVVDCLLGTGFQGDLRESYRAAIEAINESRAFVVSVDINSGMNGDTGEGSLIVRSHLTVTIGYVKRGLLTEQAGRHMERLVCADIGILLEKEEWKICKQGEHLAEDCLPCPPWLAMQVIDAKI